MLVFEVTLAAVHLDPLHQSLPITQEWETEPQGPGGWVWALNCFSPCQSGACIVMRTLTLPWPFQFIWIFGRVSFFHTWLDPVP